MLSPNMNSCYSIALVVIFVVLCQVDIGTSIECYICQSETDEGCGQGTPHEKYITDCSMLKEGSKYVACRKIENWVDFTVLKQKPTKRIIRQCASDTERDRPCYYRAGFGGRANVCDCYDDKCNSASFITNSILTIALCVVSALLVIL